MGRIFISCSPNDRELVRRIVALIEAAGNDVWCSFDDIEAGSDWQAVVAEKMKTMDCMVVLWSHNSVGNEWVTREARAGLERRAAIPVLIERVPLPQEFRSIQTADLSDWDGSPDAPEIAGLMRALEPYRFLNQRMAASPDPGASPSPARPLPMAQPSGILAKVTGAIGGVIGRLRKSGQRAKPPDEPPTSEPQPKQRNGGSGLPSPQPDAEDAPQSEPVLLGVAAPRQVVPGASFSARFVAYVAAAKQLAESHLRDLGDEGDRVVTDIAPDREARWRVGAPITVRLTGDHMCFTPAERSFEWNGRENLASFAVTVDAGAPRGTLHLCFHILLNGLEIAFIPVGAAVDVQSPDNAIHEATVHAPSSAFASYSSKDSEAVTRSLSTLAHWAPTLDIYQDCLDLTPNETFKPQLEAQIAKRDVFMLFWSRHAMDSKWVMWEFETARAKRGLNAILPMPLEDPSIAPPPPGFEEKHLRDRFMIAGYGLKKIAEIRGR